MVQETVKVNWQKIEFQDLDQLLEDLHKYVLR